jgi:hypothetical protein
VKEWQTLEPGPDEAGHDQRRTENDEKAVHDGQRLQDSANTRTSNGVPSDVAEFRAGLRGDLLLPGQDGHDSARRIWNGAFDRKPALIARCAADVTRSMAFGFYVNALACSQTTPSYELRSEADLLKCGRGVKGRGGRLATLPRWLGARG